MIFSQRPAQIEDRKWLEPFYESLMRPYVELTHTWDSSLFKKYFAPEKVSIIQVNNKDIGMIIVEYFDDHIYLSDIQIDRSFQNNGIGSTILQSLISQAKQTSRPIRLKVLKGNPAKALYERFEFRLSEEFEHSVALEYEV